MATATADFQFMQADKSKLSPATNFLLSLDIIFVFTKQKRKSGVVLYSLFLSRRKITVTNRSKTETFSITKAIASNKSNCVRDLKRFLSGKSIYSQR